MLKDSETKHKEGKPVELQLEDGTGLFYFPERRIRFVGALISVLLSAILLIGAIVCLLLVAKESIALRVGMI